MTRGRAALLAGAIVIAAASIAAAVAMGAWGLAALGRAELVTPALADTAPGTVAPGVGPAAVPPGAPVRMAPPGGPVAAPVGPSIGTAAAPSAPADDGGLTIQRVVFLVFAGALALFALLVVILRNPLTGALSLVGAFFCLAALYVMLDAHFIAAIQIIIYAGAVMVLFVFVIMLLNLSERELGVAKHRFLKGLALALLGGLSWLVWRNLESLPAAPLAAAAEVGPDFGTVKGVGRALFATWLLPFEVAGLVLLAAVVGAVAISRRASPVKPGAGTSPGAAASAGAGVAGGGGH